jgi:hypothetical protein
MTHSRAQSGRLTACTALALVFAVGPLHAQSNDAAPAADSGVAAQKEVMESVTGGQSGEAMMAEKPNVPETGSDGVPEGYGKVEALTGTPAQKEILGSVAGGQPGKAVLEEAPEDPSRETASSDTGSDAEGGASGAAAQAEVMDSVTGGQTAPVPDAGASGAAAQAEVMDSVTGGQTAPMPEGAGGASGAAAQAEVMDSVTGGQTAPVPEGAEDPGVAGMAAQKEIMQSAAGAQGNAELEAKPDDPAAADAQARAMGAQRSEDGRFTAMKLEGFVHQIYAEAYKAGYSDGVRDMHAKLSSALSGAKPSDERAAAGQQEMPKRMGQPKDATVILVPPGMSPRDAMMILSRQIAQ